MDTLALDLQDAKVFDADLGAGSTFDRFPEEECFGQGGTMLRKSPSFTTSLCSTESGYTDNEADEIKAEEEAAEDDDEEEWTESSERQGGARGRARRQNAGRRR